MNGEPVESAANTACGPGPAITRESTMNAPSGRPVSEPVVTKKSAFTPPATSWVAARSRSDAEVLSRPAARPPDFAARGDQQRSRSTSSR
jgi:hypothetical protein